MNDKLIEQIKALGIIDDVSYQWDEDDGTHYRFSMNPNDIPKIIALCNESKLVSVEKYNDLLDELEDANCLGAVSKILRQHGRTDEILTRSKRKRDRERT